MSVAGAIRSTRLDKIYLDIVPFINVDDSNVILDKNHFLNVCTMMIKCLILLEQLKIHYSDKIDLNLVKISMDYLESVDDQGKKIYKYHVRMKGITKEGLEYASKQYDNSYRGLYRELMYKKKKIILNPYDAENNSQKVLFEFTKNEVKTKDTFERELSFI